MQLHDYSYIRDVYEKIKRRKQYAEMNMEFFNSYALFIPEPERLQMYSLWNTERIKIETLLDEFKNGNWGNDFGYDSIFGQWARNNFIDVNNADYDTINIGSKNSPNRVMVYNPRAWRPK